MRHKRFGVSAQLGIAGIGNHVPNIGNGLFGRLHGYRRTAGGDVFDFEGESGTRGVRPGARRELGFRDTRRRRSAVVSERNEIIFGAGHHGEFPTEIRRCGRIIAGHQKPRDNLAVLLLDGSDDLGIGHALDFIGQHEIEHIGIFVVGGRNRSRHTAGNRLRRGVDSDRQRQIGGRRCLRCKLMARNGRRRRRIVPEGKHVIGGPGRQGGRFVTVFALAQHSGDAAVFRIGFIERRDQRSVVGKILVDQFFGLDIEEIGLGIVRGRHGHHGRGGFQLRHRNGESEVRRRHVTGGRRDVFALHRGASAGRDDFENHRIIRRRHDHVARQRQAETSLRIQGGNILALDILTVGIGDIFERSALPDKIIHDLLRKTRHLGGYGGLRHGSAVDHRRSVVSVGIAGTGRESQIRRFARRRRRREFVHLQLRSRFLLLGIVADGVDIVFGSGLQSEHPFEHLRRVTVRSLRQIGGNDRVQNVGENLVLGHSLVGRRRNHVEIIGSFVVGGNDGDIGGRHGDILHLEFEGQLRRFGGRRRERRLLQIGRNPALRRNAVYIGIVVGRRLQRDEFDRFASRGDYGFQIGFKGQLLFFGLSLQVIDIVVQISLVGSQFIEIGLFDDRAIIGSQRIAGSYGNHGVGNPDIRNGYIKGVLFRGGGNFFVRIFATDRHEQKSNGSR